MKVLLTSGKAIYVEFTVIHKEKKRNHSTKCEIFDGKDKKDDRVPVSVGIAKCNQKDKYNKAIGKARALDRAIKNIYNLKDQRNIRKKIWVRFFDLLQTPDKESLKHAKEDEK